MLTTFWFYVDKINALLVHVEGHVPCEFDGEDMWDPPSSNEMVLTIVLSLDKQQWSRVLVGGKFWFSHKASGLVSSKPLNVLWTNRLW